MRSFAGSTLVLMTGGERNPISDIEVGDKVVATAPHTGEQQVEPVTAVWVHQDNLVDLRVADGVVTTTQDHPFYTPPTALGRQHPSCEEVQVHGA
ncbi:Hint domain-containing protein [Actinopolymorpha pittospori]